MVHSAIGANPKLRRLTPAERWCYVAGVLAIASQSPERGVLLLTECVAADANDVADQAAVPRSVAVSALSKLRDLGMLASQEGDPGADVVRDWHEWQPQPPKPSDLPEATRARKQKSRASQGRDSSVTGGVTSRDVTRDPSREVEEEIEKPPLTPPAGGKAAEEKIELAHGLAGYLVPVADALRRVAAAKPGALVPTDAAVARSLRDMPNKDFLPLVGDFEHYWLDGRGSGTVRKDIVQTWRNWLARQPDVLRKTPPAGQTNGGARRETIDEERERKLREQTI